MSEFAIPALYATSLAVAIIWFMYKIIKNAWRDN